MNQRQKRRRTRRGLTLIEVMAVATILVIMGTLVGLAVRGFVQRAKVDVTKTQIELFKRGLDLYWQDFTSYPTELQALREPPSDLPNPDKWQRPYLEEDIPLDPWDSEYQYEFLGPESYRIWSTGPNIDDDQDDISYTKSG